MRFLFIIDPLESLNLETETSLLMMEEAAHRGHENVIATIDDLYLVGNEPRVASVPITLDLTRQPFYQLGQGLDGACNAFDLVLMRKDPPVDERYLAATFVLDKPPRRCRWSTTPWRCAR